MPSRKNLWIRGVVRRLPILYRLGHFVRAMGNCFYLAISNPSQLDRIANRLRRGIEPVMLQSPVAMTPRYGWGRPPHPELYELIDRHRDSYRATLESFLVFKDDLLAIPVDEVENEATGTVHAHWRQRPPFLHALDAACLYCLIATRRPARYVEVGSGNSTLFVHRAITDHELPTQITSIDPEPRLPIDRLCHELRRERLEQTDQAIFGDLDPGDVLFIDGSHVSCTNSDVTVAFLEILPRIKPGVLIQIHDVFLPYDYPTYLADWFCNEQYLVAVYLLAAKGRYEITLPTAFVHNDPELSAVLQPMWEALPSDTFDIDGYSLWITKTE